MGSLIDMVFAGIMIGSIYALLAVGFVIVYKSTRVFNFSYPSLVLVGIYLSYFMITRLHFNPWIAVVCAVMFGFLLGFLIERLFLRRLIGEPVLSVIILTIGLAELLKGLVAIIFGVEERSYPALFPIGFIDVGGHAVPEIYLWLIAVNLVAFAVFALFYYRSPYGLAMRAVACQQDWASLLGVSPSRVFALSWGFASALGAVVGIFLAMIVSVNLFLEPFVFRSLPAAVFGGMDSIVGALIGGLCIGISESFVGGLIDPYVNGGAKDVVAYVVLLIILLIKPYGLFGQEEIERL